MKLIQFLMILGIACLISESGYSAAAVSLPDKTGVKCQTVSFPVTASGFPTDMGAVEFFVAIDTNVLYYTGYTLGTLIIGGAVNYIPSESRVGVNWFSASPTNINGVLVTLSFTYKSGFSNLVFQNGDFVTINFVPVYPFYDDGTVAPLLSTTYYVADTVGSSGNGLSWATAFKTIHEATNHSLKAGDVILVKPAAYNDTVVIRSSGSEIVPVKYNVSVSDTNKITFPTGTDLSCIDLANHPGEYYAYVFRSWNCNNGVYKILSVNTSQRHVTVGNSAFKPETGAASDTSKLQASIGQPIIFKKSSSNPVSERVIINAGSFAAAKAGLYVGRPIGDGSDANPSNYNIIDGFDITGVTNKSGLRIQGSSYNLYINARIYELDSVAVLVSGSTSHPAKYNMIQDNQIYNTKSRALKIGVHNGTTANNNFAYFTHFKGNEIYSQGAGGNINFNSAVDLHKNTAFTVIEKNTFRNFNLKTARKGALEVWENVRKSMVYGNFIKNVGKVVTDTNAIIYIHRNNNNIDVFNNVLLDSLATDDDVFAFRLNGSNSVSNRVTYNTIYHIDNGILFEDSGSPATVDFKLQDNIIYINYTSGGFYFRHKGTTGRFTVSYNCYPSTPTIAGDPYHGETGRQVGDPSFLNNSFFMSAAGFSLQAGSICIIHGTPVSSITRDYLCRSRNATTPCIGAFEGPITYCSWTGIIDQNWHNYRNWDIQYVPTASISAIIPDRTNDPLVSNSDAVCKSIQVQSGAQVRINNSKTLTVYY